MYMIMASIAGGTASQAARITDRTRSIFRAILTETILTETILTETILTETILTETILTENGIADTGDAILEQEMIMFFKLSE
jgi:hypothetical protein